jgi:acyl-coenzyme A thioesterase PaaI-like protein
MRRFPSYPGCPVCGSPDVNPHSLAVRWEWEESTRTVVGRFRPGIHHLGYENRLHGGLLAALLDEAMAWACAVRMRSYCVTGDLQVRFKDAAPLGEPLVVSGRAEGDRWGRYVRATGEARAADGIVFATAGATFAALPRPESERLRQALVFEPGDVDVLERDDRDAG